jgi:transcriptional regulator with XRE-family HTH domain
MGYARPRPRRLAKKLLQIRRILGLSQSELRTKLGVAQEITNTRISEYERNKKEPNLFVLREYARVAGVNLQRITDDLQDLPRKIPGRVKYRLQKPSPPKRRKTKQSPRRRTERQGKS